MRSVTAGILVGAMAASAGVEYGVAQETLAVYGSRTSSGSFDDEGYPMPHVVVRRRADFLLFDVWAVCDTRDADQRRGELRDTLETMITEAGRDANIELSRLENIPGDDAIVVPFTADTIEESFANNYRSRADTTYVRLLVKTPVKPDDTLRTAAGRIERFVAGLTTVGRSEFVLADSETLSVVDPGQYRYEIIDAIASDANRIAATVGEGYAARFEGLEQEVSWYRSDVLELTLYIPHRMEIVPASVED